MSYTRRIIETARDGLNTLMARVAADDTPLSHVHAEELHGELSDRKAARDASGKGPLDNPRAKLAGASEAAQRQRQKMAADREARILGARRKQQEAQQRAQDAAFREAQERARRQTRSSSNTSAGSQQSSGSRRTQGFPFGRHDEKLAQYYKVLDLAPGASFDEVKQAYRKAMRKYHPDRHAGNPKKQKAATELTMRVTQAYNELEQHLKKR